MNPALGSSNFSQRQRQLLSWLFVCLLLVSTTTSAGHFHLDEESAGCGHHSSHCSAHHTHHAPSESDCSLCDLIKLNQLLSTDPAIVAWSCKIYRPNTSDYSSITIWHTRQHLARAPPGRSIFA